MKFKFSMLGLLLAAAALHAQETPTITITKGDKITIAVSKVDGAEGVADAKTLQNDLAMSGYFTVVPADRAQYVASGTSGGGSLAGRVADRGGKTALSKTYNGAGRAKVHHFADD